MKRALVLLAGCATAQGEPVAVVHDRAPAVHAGLCITKGKISDGWVTEPTVRAVALGSRGDAATLAFKFHGDSEHVRALASGQDRRQLGLKLRAANGCNLVYVMWRLDGKPKLEVSVKVNPGARTHADCGANGYTKVKPATSQPPPALDPDSSHTLRAEIAGDELTAWIDDQVTWRGPLPEAARGLAGPAGVRSDNLAYDIVDFTAPGGGTVTEQPKCHSEDSD